MDQQSSNNSEGRHGGGEKKPMTRFKKPASLLDGKARHPRSNEDFLGCYQPIWFPGVRTAIRKEGDRYVSQEQDFYGPVPGSWTTRTEPSQLTLLRDQLGFTFKLHGSQRLV